MGVRQPPRAERPGYWGPSGTMVAAHPATHFRRNGGTVRSSWLEEPIMDRRIWDRIVSSAAAVIAIALIVIGGAAVYGRTFGRDNVQDRCVRRRCVPAYRWDDARGAATARGFRRPDRRHRSGSRGLRPATSGGHLAEVNDGATHSETSSAAREEGLDAEIAADLQIKADTLFKGEICSRSCSTLTDGGPWPRSLSTSERH